MNNIIADAFRGLAHLSGPAGMTPPGAAVNLLSGLGKQLVDQVATQVTNALFFGATGQQGAGQRHYENFAGPGGSGIGAGTGAGTGIGAGGGNLLEQLLKQILQQLGINPQNSPFNAGAGQNNVTSFNQGVTNGLTGNTFGSPQHFPLNPQSASDFLQAGSVIGSQLGSKAGLEALNDVNVSTKKGPGHFAALDPTGLLGGNKVTGGSKGTREEIGKFMDQHPEVFGKPKSPLGIDNPKNWADALKNSKSLDENSLKQFQTAKNDLKSVMAGIPIPTSPNTPPGSASLLNADAQLYSSHIKNDAFKLFKF